VVVLQCNRGFDWRVQQSISNLLFNGHHGISLSSILASKCEESFVKHVQVIKVHYYYGWKLDVQSPPILFARTFDLQASSFKVDENQCNYYLGTSWTSSTP